MAAEPEAADIVGLAVRSAHAAAPDLAAAPETAIDAALRSMARLLSLATDVVLRANAEDIAAAADAGMSGGMLDRLRLDTSRLASMASQITALADVAAEPVRRHVRTLENDLVHRVIPA